MSPELSLTFKEIVIAGALVAAFIIGLIVLGRLYLRKQSESYLNNQSKSVSTTSPLVGRNKYPEVDVFAFSNQFFMLGLVFSLLIVVGAIGLTSYDQQAVIPDNALDMEFDIEIEPPRSADPPPPPPPPPPPLIKEVPDEVLLEEEEDLEFLDQSISEDTEVEAEEVVEAPKEEVAPPPPPPPPPPERKVAEIFQIVEEMPHFKGCESVSDKKERYDCANKKLLEFIYSNIKYPPLARENNIEGTVVIRFVVNENGKVSDAEIIRDIGGGTGAEALRIVNMMNDSGASWIPGRQRDRKVKVQMNLPVKFKLIT